MAEATIPVDLLNPGQVFACLGILEAADLLLGDAAAAFVWDDGQEPTFHVAAGGTDPPVGRVMRFLEEAEVVTRVPVQSPTFAKWRKKWGAVPEVDQPRRPFRSPDPGMPATLPIVLRDKQGNEIVIDYWGDATRATKRDKRQVLGRNGRLPRLRHRT